MPFPIKQLFDNVRSILSRRVYLDNNATTPLDKDVHQFMVKVQKKFYGNPSSMHLMGLSSREIIEEARLIVAGVINASASEIIFTSGATEANNTIVKSAATLYPKGHFITSTIEHQSVLTVFKSLEKTGFSVTFIEPEKSGEVSPEKIINAIKENTALISIMHVNNETGAVNDIGKIAELAHSKNILFHSDIVQSFGKLETDIKDIPVDYLSFSAHKIYGPKGCGAMFIRSGAPFYPLIEGGHQERIMRAGTEELVSIAGFGKACEKIKAMDKKAYLNNMGKIRNEIFEGIREIYPDAALNGTLQGLSSTLNIKFPEGVHNSELITFLDYYKIAVSSGSACVAGSEEPSHVLISLGLSPSEAASSIRISIGKYNTIRDAHRFLSVLEKFKKEQKEFFSYVFPEQLQKNNLDLTNKIFVDLRDEKQVMFDKGLKDSVYINPNLKQLKMLPKDKEIVLICEDGYISNFYAPLLRRAGWSNVKVLFGGLIRWRLLQMKNSNKRIE